MPQTQTIKGGKHAATSARSYVSVPVRRNRRAHRGAQAYLRGKRGLLLQLAVPTAAIIAFSLSATVRDWLLGALGYGLIPVTLWLATFAFMLRYKRPWIKRFWRVWLGSALLVAVSLGILSMFNASSGVMERVSLGGYWGQYLGGSPVYLGVVKVAFLILLSPLLLFPRRATPIYGRVARKLLRASALTSKRLATNLALAAGALAMRLFSRQQNASVEGTVERKASPSSRRAVRFLGRTESTSPADDTIIAPDFSESEMETGQDRREKTRQNTRGWKLPSLELLSKGAERPVPQADLKQMGQHIEDTLSQHRVEVAVEDIRTGPRVIRFGLVPGWVKQYRESRGVKSKSKDIPPIEMSRVKVQSILIREKDLALALKTPYLRLEAPVPGEALVGLEMPNPFPRTVVLRSVAESAAFQKIAAAGGLPVAMGENTGGEPVVADLIDLPHLLIAGATGSGKSVCINSIVASLLVSNRPDRLRMLMVDPKRVELTPFNGIPHLIAPVIVDTDEVLVVLRAIQNEMLRRYKLLEETGVRNIEGYNKKVRERMPFLVIVIDELADLMMSAAYEAEQSLVRLAQLGRATGIHLILSTQRPSVNVVTGLLKANIPARIAFAVASQVDSRVILDSAGAEKLLGKGDMLILTSDSPKPMRVQGTFVHDREIEKLVEFWGNQSGPPLPEIPLDEHAYSDPDNDQEQQDDLLDRARELAERYQRISPSVLQRRLQVGYSRAVQLAELLEEEGLIQGSAELTSSSRRGWHTPER